MFFWFLENLTLIQKKVEEKIIMDIPVLKEFFFLAFFFPAVKFVHSYSIILRNRKRFNDSIYPVLTNFVSSNYI